jgi:hypothetical protein
MDKHRKNIEKEIATVVFYMQGGLNFNDAYNLSVEQLNDIAAVIHEHYDKQNNQLNTMSKNNR